MVSRNAKRVLLFTQMSFLQHAISERLYDSKPMSIEKGIFPHLFCAEGYILLEFCPTLRVVHYA